MQTLSCKVPTLSIYFSEEENSPILSQMLYGETCSITEVKGNYAKIITDFDNTEGWVFWASLQKEIPNTTKQILTEPYTHLHTKNGKMLIPISSEISTTQEMPTPDIRKVVEYFLNAPFLKGGRSIFGLDASALVQLVYKAIRIPLPRWANEQIHLGNAINFLEESEVGDIAFFEDENGEIIHTGIMLNHYEIIHCWEKVRIDLIDTAGIFNRDLNKHTHKLRVIKRIKH